MGMARLLASCRAKMICMGLGDGIALPLKKKMQPCAFVELLCYRKSGEIQHERYFLALINR
jgi:hypothetical protein